MPLPPDGVGSASYWTSQVESATSALMSLASQRNWDDNIRSYLGQGDRKRWGKNTTLVRKDFSLVEGKKALLWFQTPDVSATGAEPQYQTVAPLVASVVNKFLSPAETNAQSMVDEVLMDVLCPSGIGVSKIGFEAFENPLEPEIPVPNPVMPSLPAIDIATGQPITQPNVVRQLYFWNRTPPKMFLYPPTFIGSDWDTSPWLGYKFRVARPIAIRRYGLTENEAQSTGTPDLNKDLVASDVSRSDAQSMESDTVELVEIWYRACDVNPDIGDPEIIYQLVMLKDRERPLVHRESPYQKIENGKLVQGMRGYPIHPLTLRYVSDQAIPPSDCSVSRDQVDELSRGRTQMIDQRDRSVPLTMYDTSRVPSESIQKYLKGDTQELIGVPSFDAASPPIVGINKGQFPRENFTFNDIVNRDIAEAWALGSNQLGVDTDTRRTATELSLMQAATDTRMDKERVRVLRWFSKGCEKLLALIQMFADDQEFVQIVGPDGLVAMQQWDKTAIAGTFAITLAPDSSQRVDAVSKKKEAIDIFKMFGNDPLINQVELRKSIFRTLGMDANKLVMQPQPKPPEKPQVSVSLKGEDLAPIVPQYMNVAALLSVLGIGMAPPQPMAMPPEGQATNPGPVPEVSEIGKRSDEQGSGQLPGAGAAPDVGRVAGR